MKNSKEHIKKELAKIIATITVNENIPTIESLTGKLNCSRGIIQNILALLEQDEVIKLSRKSNGTTLVAKNKKKLTNILFADKVHLNITYNESYFNFDDIILNNISHIFEQVNLTPYYSFNLSTPQSIELLKADKIECALVSRQYYNLFLDSEYAILHTINTLVSKVSLLGEALPENYFAESKLSLPEAGELVLVCKQFFYKLIIG